MKFKDVAHLYIGCKLQTPYGIGTFKVYFMPGQIMLDDSETPTYGVDYPSGHLRSKHAKPILRPMSEMTDDYFTEKYGKLEEEFHETQSHASSCQVLAMLYLRLTQDGWDVFGLIDSGEAVNMKEVEP